MITSEIVLEINETIFCMTSVVGKRDLYLYCNRVREREQWPLLKPTVWLQTCKTSDGTAQPTCLDPPSVSKSQVLVHNT